MSSNYYEGTSILDPKKNEMPIGTGMFKISNINGNIYYLDKNGDYWNKNREPLLSMVLWVKYIMHLNQVIWI